MLIKKKPSPPLKNMQLSSKLTHDNKHNSRKSYQKHSRKGTKDYEPFNLHKFINLKFYASACESSNRNLLYSMNSIFYGSRDNIQITIANFHWKQRKHKLYLIQRNI